MTFGVDAGRTFPYSGPPVVCAPLSSNCPCYENAKVQYMLGLTHFSVDSPLMRDKPSDVTALSLVGGVVT